MKKRFFYVAFLSIGTVVEGMHAFHFEPAPYMNILYSIGFLFFIFMGREPWVFYPSFLLIGLVAIISFLLMALNLYNPVVKMVDGAICAVLFFWALRYVQWYQDNREN
jgi:hypothetical protein